MATLTWVGGTNTWNTTNTAVWSPAQVPTAADNVVFNSASTYTVTLTGALACLDITVSAGTVTFSSTGTLAVSGNMSLSSGTVWSATGTITFNATTSKTITTNATTISAGMTFNGVGGSWQLIDALTLSSARTLTLTNGTFDLNSKTVVTGLFSSSAATARTIAFGTGSITCNGASGTLWTTATVTNLTITGTPVVNISNSGGTATTVNFGALSEAQSISFNFTAGTYALTTGAGSVKNLNLTGYNGTWSSTAALSIYGDLTLSSSAGFSWTGGAGTVTFASTSATVRNIVSNGQTINSNAAVKFNGINGAWKFIDALTTASLEFIAGTIDGNSMTASSGGLVYFSGTGNLKIKSLYVGTGIIRGNLELVGDTNFTNINFQSGNINLAGYVLYVSSAMNETATGTKAITFNGGTINVGGFYIATTFSTVAGSSPGYILMTYSGNTSFNGGGFSYACTLVNACTGVLTITGANTFVGISNSIQPASFVFPAGATTTLTDWNVNGTAGNPVTITSSTAGTAASISKASGTVSSDYLNIQDSAAIGGATWYAGANSTNLGGNTGWIFTAVPPPKRSFGWIVT